MFNWTRKRCLAKQACFQNEDILWPLVLNQYFRFANAGGLGKYREEDDNTYTGNMAQFPRLRLGSGTRHVSLQIISVWRIVGKFILKYHFIVIVNGFLFLIYAYIYETEFLCVTLVALELAFCRSVWRQSQKSTSLCLPSLGIKGMHHHCTAPNIFLSNYWYTGKQCISSIIVLHTEKA